MSKLRILVLAAAGAAVTGLSAAHATTFDGNWSVEVIARKGKCDNYRWSLDVAGGRIAHVQDDLAQAKGGIDPHGHVSITLTRGSDELSATGEVSGKEGAGNWTSETLNCSGDWRAERQPLP